MENTNDEELQFVFKTVDDPSHYAHIFTKENFKTLEKWGLTQNMELVKFSFNIAFELRDVDKFLKNLFNDKTVRQNFPPLATITTTSENNFIEKIKYAKLDTNATTLDIFDAIYENDICNKDTGYIKQDYDIYAEDITISDKLKQALLLEETENYGVFSEQVRNEFLFHIFKRIVVGGPLCQFENTVTEYMNMTKCFYKGK